MKKIAICITIIFVLIVCVVANRQKNENTDILRFHIRANSNSSFDQYIKYDVKDKIINLLSPCFENFTSIGEAENFLESSKNVLEEYANSILAQNKCDYKCNIKLDNAYFEEKEIDGISFKAGIYKALVISLGTGSGNNWWCLVYPSLSFVPINGNIDYNDIIYKSKLVEIYDKIV